ncbi:rhomboid family-domain-containing protein [Circinella umbellata]|nr:rhomboid family-domain-containing protein [Circinella umbellata]
MTYQHYHHTTASSDSNITMVSCTEKQQQKQQNVSNNNDNISCSSMRSKLVCHKQQHITTTNNSNPVTDDDNKGFEKSPFVILDFSSKPSFFVQSEKYTMEDTSVLNYPSTDKDDGNKNVLTAQHQQEYKLYNNNSLSRLLREWIDVFSSGVTPFGKPAWPPVFIWIIIILLFFVMSGELLVSKETVGEFIELKPFNYMLGPSIQIIIQTGARFPPCMRNTAHMPPTQNYICINATTAETIQTSTFISLFESENEVSTTQRLLQQENNITESENNTDYMMELSICSLEDICGFGGFANEKAPDQAFRFLTPLFVHSGLLHWGLNMIALVSIGFKLERLMSGWRFGVAYVISGIFGNVFGANFAPPTTPKLGCGAAVFGLMGCVFIDLALRWRTVQRPFRHLVKLIVFTILGFCILGVLPGVDSFSNIGGLLAGFLIGISMVPADTCRNKKETFFLWTLRIIGFTVLVISSVLLLNKFYKT